MTTETTRTVSLDDALEAIRERAAEERRDIGLADGDTPSAAYDTPRLLRVISAVRDLCRDADGNWLEPSSSLPVGEFQAALALLTEEPSP